jgi:thiol:disulfide interchange protein
MKYLIAIILFFAVVKSEAQEAKSKDIYSVNADAEAEISAALRQAKAEGKHVMLMFGGNWCRWCRMYDKFRLENARIDSASNVNYVFLHVNYSKENKNSAVLENYDFPQRFGFPVFVVLNADGKRIHTQNSAYLEEGEGYSEKKVLEFYSQWSPAALRPEQYK